MGTPKERPTPLREELVKVSLRGGELVIPFHFGRQPVASDAMGERLKGYKIAGAKVIYPDWKEYDMSDEDLLAEISPGENHPLDIAPVASLGVVLSNEGFVKYSETI